MGDRGPPAKPEALRKLEGADEASHQAKVEKQPLPEFEKPPEGTPPPAHLKGHAAEEWRRLFLPLQRLGLLTIASLKQFEVYCDAYGTWREATDELDKRDDAGAKMIVLMTKNGSVMVNPWTWIKKNAASQMTQAMREFGMTPAAASRLAVAPLPPRAPGGKVDEEGEIEREPQPEAAGKFSGLIGRNARPN